MTTTINATPTWGEFGNILRSVALVGTTESLINILPEAAKAFAAAEAFNQVAKTFTPEQAELALSVMRAELAKQRD